MSDSFELWEKPKKKEIYMLAGWRQWVDGGAISSKLPRYLGKQTKARKIGELNSDGYYLFQLPGTQDLIRPVVKHIEGHPQELQRRSNEFYYAEVEDKGIVYFVGDEPHLDVERYTRTFLEAAKALKVKRIILFGGIYGAVPYDKERFVSSIYSLPSLRDEVSNLVVNLSSYHGGASIGSYVCKRGGEQGIEVIGLYTFSPIFQFASSDKIAEAIHIEEDYMAWLGVMQRVNYMLKMNFDLSDLEEKNEILMKEVKTKLDELDKSYPDLGVAEYMRRLSEEYTENSFTPLEEVWQDELRRLGDQFEPGED